MMEKHIPALVLLCIFVHHWSCTSLVNHNSIVLHQRGHRDIPAYLSAMSFFPESLKPLVSNYTAAATIVVAAEKATAATAAMAAGSGS
eukprot:349801-Chlamydomonas_euryale.AAC.32